MSTAVLISGQARTFADCVANQHWMVFRHLKDPMFFVSVADDERAADMHILEAYYPGRVHIEKVKQPETFDYMPPFSAVRHAPYVPTPNRPEVVLSIMRQLWHYKRVWYFAQECVGAIANEFTTFVRCRPDLFFHRFDEFSGTALYRTSLFTDGVVLDRYWFGPWKATCGAVNDRFSIMGKTAAPAYFNAIDQLPEMIKAGCPLHPESIQAEALRLGRAVINNTLDVEFTCVREPGKGDHVALVEYPGELAAYIAASHR